MLTINNNCQQKQNITFQNRYKALNVFNPISYYSDKYFAKSAKKSHSLRQPFLPEITQTLKLTKLKSGKDTISLYEMTPPNAKNYIIFLHGMAQDVSNYQSLYKKILEKNIGIIAVEYRGYGCNNPAKISENKLRADIEAAYNHITKKNGINPKNIIVVGHSMGGALATHFASKHHDIKGLILIAPITNLAEVGTKFSKNPNIGMGIPNFIWKLTEKIKPLKFLHSLKFNSLNKITKAETPTYILQSKNDAVTTIESVRKLAKNARKKGILEQFITFPNGGHKVDTEKINAISEILDKFVKP